MTSVEKRAAEWIVSGDTGVSSEAIWAVMMGVNAEWASVPWDSEDFGRCLRLIEKIPEWKKRLPEVVEKHSSWKGVVRFWDEIETRYRTGVFFDVTHFVEQLEKRRWEK